MSDGYYTLFEIQTERSLRLSVSRRDGRADYDLVKRLELIKSRAA